MKRTVTLTESQLVDFINRILDKKREKKEAKTAFKNKIAQVENTINSTIAGKYLVDVNFIKPAGSELLGGKKSKTSNRYKVMKVFLGDNVKYNSKTKNINGDIVVFLKSEDGNRTMGVYSTINPKTPENALSDVYLSDDSNGMFQYSYKIPELTRVLNQMLKTNFFDDKMWGTLTN